MIWNKIGKVWDKDGAEWSVYASEGPSLAYKARPGDTVPNCKSGSFPTKEKALEAFNLK